MTETKLAPRRVVTGLDAEGKSCVIIDGPVPDFGSPARLVWRNGAVPVDNSSNEDPAAQRFTMDMFRDGSCNFMITELPVGISHFMHITDTIDYMFIVSGRGVLELETGDTEVGPGDYVIGRGVMHSWRVDGPEPLVMASVILPAQPLAGDRTV
jgi:mannose-6-phosphate isomerase-like protein (cupin superfamily)